MSMEIAYDEVEKLGPNLSTAQKVWIGVGVGVAALLIISVVAINKRESDLRPGGSGPTFEIVFSTDGSDR